MTILRSSKNIFFFGNQGEFSASVFSQLLLQGIPVSRVFCASIAPASVPEKMLPVAQPTKAITLVNLAQQQGIPIHYLSNQAALNSIKPDNIENPDYILVACFPYRLPSFIIDWPLLGCLNIHPSLLPKYRGPDPIFWQLQKNEFQTGVSLHLVTPELDAGPIVDQKICPYVEGAERNDIEIMLAESGAALFISLITTKSAPSFTGKQQDESLASYYQYPSTDNYEVSSSWSAKHAYNFINGTHSPSGFYTAKIKNQTIYITSALEYSNNGNILGKTPKLKNEQLIQFSPGILRVTIG
jgi:methionyl-tRNA formyltransferase